MTFDASPKILISPQHKTKLVDHQALRHIIEQEFISFAIGHFGIKPLELGEGELEELHDHAAMHTESIMLELLPACIVEGYHRSEQQLPEEWPEFLEDVCMDCLAEMVKEHQESKKGLLPLPGLVEGVHSDSPIIAGIADKLGKRLADPNHDGHEEH